MQNTGPEIQECDLKWCRHKNGRIRNLYNYQN